MAGSASRRSRSGDAPGPRDEAASSPGSPPLLPPSRALRARHAARSCRAATSAPSSSSPARSPWAAGRARRHGVARPPAAARRVRSPRPRARGPGARASQGQPPDAPRPIRRDRPTAAPVHRVVAARAGRLPRSEPQHLSVCGLEELAWMAELDESESRAGRDRHLRRSRARGSRSGRSPVAPRLDRSPFGSARRAGRRSRASPGSGLLACTMSPRGYGPATVPSLATRWPRGHADQRPARLPAFGADAAPGPAGSGLRRRHGSHVRAYSREADG